MATGWTWEYVWETMTFQKLEVFGRVWKRNPPLNVSMAQVNAILKAYFGIEDKTSNKPKEPVLPGFMTQPDFEE